MLSRQESLETPPKLNVTAWRDPLVEAAGHRPGNPYIETVWLAILGPGSTFGWHRLARIAAASKSTVTIDAGEFAASIGLGTGLGRNAPISRTLARLEAFGTLRRAGDTLGVRLALPDVPERRAAKLCPSAQVAHRRFAHRHQSPTPAVPGQVASIEL